MPTSSRSGRAARWVAAAALVAVVAVTAVDGGRAAPASREAVEELLWDLQIVPLDGRTPPALEAEGLDGTRRSLAKLRGRPVLVYFWATW